MVAGNIKQLHTDSYKALVSPSVMEAIRGLHVQTPVGEKQLDGSRVVLKVVETMTHTKDAGSFEAHRQHIDIHYIISGNECVQYEAVDNMTATAPYDEKEDFCLYAGTPDSRTAFFGEGDFYILYPSDAHNPNGCVEQPALLKKAIFKVSI